VRVWIE
jgi:serine/threonine protein kinase